MRVITDRPYHALFAKTMFIEPTADELEDFEPEALVLHAPAVEADPEEDGTRTGHVHRPAPGPHRGADRRHVLRRRDQEVDLHRDERPPAARGRLPDALLGERRRRRPRRDLLRALRHGQDDALGRPRALADRRRRARLGRQRRLQLRGRLLREGDPPLRRGRAGDLPDDPHVRDDPRERRRRRERRARPRRRLEDREHPRRLQARADRERAADEAGRPPERGDHADRRRVRDPAADRAADPRPGDVLLPLRLHGQGRRHGDRRHRAAGDVLDVLRRAVPAAAAGGVRADARREARPRTRTRPSGSSTPAGRAGRSARASACRSRATRALLHAALDEGLRERRVPDRPGVRLRGAGRRCRAWTTALLDPRSTWADPEAYDRKARELARDVPRELRAVRRSRRARRHRRRARRSDAARTACPIR